MSNQKGKIDTRQKEYEEYTTARGIVLKIYPVSSHTIMKINPPKVKPKRPFVEMQLKGGVTQRRPAKQGDEGWDEYQEQLEEWEIEKDQLQGDVQLVLALRDYSYPDDLQLPDHVLELAELNLIELPDNPYSKKAMWIRENVVGQNDELQIGWIIQKLSGVPEEVIDQMKDNFRSVLLGETTDAVGAAVAESVAGKGDDQK